jgi:hypothetical protein
LKFEYGHGHHAVAMTRLDYIQIRRGADKSLAFPICSTAKRIFLGWVNKEVRTTKCGAQRGNM